MFRYRIRTDLLPAFLVFPILVLTATACGHDSFSHVGPSASTAEDTDTTAEPPTQQVDGAQPETDNGTEIQAPSPAVEPDKMEPLPLSRWIFLGTPYPVLSAVAVKTRFFADDGIAVLFFDHEISCDDGAPSSVAHYAQPAVSVFYPRRPNGHYGAPISITFVDASAGPDAWLQESTHTYFEGALALDENGATVVSGWVRIVEVGPTRDSSIVGSFEAALCPDN